MIPTDAAKPRSGLRAIAALLGLVVVLASVLLTYPILVPGVAPSTDSTPLDSMPESRAASAPAERTTPSALVVCVLDTFDRPIPGATATLRVYDSVYRQWMEDVRKCDDDGFFLVQRSLAGVVQSIEFRAPGHVSTEMDRADWTDLCASQLGTIRLVKGAWTLTGTVKRPDGSPHADAMLICTVPNGKAYPERLLPMPRIERDGHFTIEGLPLRDLDVYASVRGEPGSRSRARRVRSPGKDGVVSIELVLESTYTITGQLLDLQGTTATRFHVEALDDGHAFAGMDSTDNSGHFTIHVPDSARNLTFRVRRARRFVAEFPWTRGHEESPSIRLPPRQVEKMLWFNVTDSGAPVASSAVEYRVVTCPGGDERFASARRQMDATPRMFEVRYAPCPSDGVKLTVDSPDHFVETVATTIENAEASVLEVALRRSSTIRGVLTGRDTRKVVTPLTIELLRADANGRNASIEREDHATHSDPGSSFAEYHLTPGRYRIDVRPGPYSGMHSFEVVVKELGVQEVRQAIPTFGALEGSVAWEREPEDVMVRVTIQRGDEPAVSKELRLQGSFALERLEPGKYIVAAEARKKNGAVWRDSKNVHVRRQQTSSVALHLTPR